MNFQPAWGQGGERVYYQDSQIMVTSTRFQAGTTMYPIRNISSVGIHDEHQQRVKPADHSAAIAFLILAMIPVCLVGQSPWVLAAVPIFGLASLVFALRAKEARWVETQHWVMVDTNGMNRPVYWTPDRAVRDAIVGALHQAIAGG